MKCVFGENLKITFKMFLQTLRNVIWSLYIYCKVPKLSDARKLPCNLPNKNSAEVNIAPAFGEITTACNVGQAKNGSWCLLEEKSMQGFIPTNIAAAEICTLILDLT